MNPFIELFKIVLKYNEEESQEKHYEEFVKFLIDGGYYDEKNARALGDSYVDYFTQMDDYNRAGFLNAPSKYHEENPQSTCEIDSLIE